MRILDRKIVSFAGRKVELILARIKVDRFDTYNFSYKRVLVRNVKCKRCGKSHCGHGG